MWVLNQTDAVFNGRGIHCPVKKAAAAVDNDETQAEILGRKTLAALMRDLLPLPIKFYWLRLTCQEPVKDPSIIKALHFPELLSCRTINIYYARLQITQCRLATLNPLFVMSEDNLLLHVPQSLPSSWAEQMLKTRTFSKLDCSVFAIGKVLPVFREYKASVSQHKAVALAILDTSGSSTIFLDTAANCHVVNQSLALTGKKQWALEPIKGYLGTLEISPEKGEHHLVLRTPTGRSILLGVKNVFRHLAAATNLLSVKQLSCQTALCFLFDMDGCNILTRDGEIHTAIALATMSTSSYLSLIHRRLCHNDQTGHVGCWMRAASPRQYLVYNALPRLRDQEVQSTRAHTLASWVPTWRPVPIPVHSRDTGYNFVMTTPTKTVLAEVKRILPLLKTQEHTL
ncbi:hypothetical protein BDK51DRAFT_47767 [Blyttiomyces helicus]|uniref:Uncharacterized protein n=1 Tax=Blyttiomyces helicus TaxID=388810 RepID=A0A4P9WA91_9FUNG|nr:hypothetical protein BDK51DRAFT_47767 [Blyttiomyces helicus]|eukprot:RKO89501.1 hypothetical protein BDK51DRAFT_47767 [Blyttiomyces helicus]